MYVSVSYTLFLNVAIVVVILFIMFYKLENLCDQALNPRGTVNVISHK